MEILELIKKYLAEPKVMQLATVSGDQPWICTVHFAFDDELNLYWISSPSRRHSQELAKNHKAAVAIPIKFPEKPVIGVQLEGVAQPLSGDELKKGLDIYDARFGLSQEAKDDIASGKDADAVLYRFTPSLFVLFDTVDFPDSPRREYRQAGNT